MFDTKTKPEENQKGSTRLRGYKQDVTRGDSMKKNNVTPGIRVNVF